MTLLNLWIILTATGCDKSEKYTDCTKQISYGIYAKWKTAVRQPSRKMSQQLVATYPELVSEMVKRQGITEQLKATD